MKQKVRLILLRITRYNDRHDIALGLTREGGAVSFMLPAGKGRGASRMRALLMPGSIVEGELNMGVGRTIGSLGDVMPMIPLHAVYANPVKGSVAMFIADVVAAVTAEGSSDPLLWDFVAGSMEALNALSPSRLANFPLVFMASLAGVLGIAPDSGSFSRGRILDLRDGIYRPTHPPHSDTATAAESRVVAFISRLDYSNMHRLRLSRDDRARLLDGMLKFVTLHHARVDSLRTLEVLRSIV